MLDLLSDPGLIVVVGSAGSGIVIKAVAVGLSKTKRNPIDWHWVREQEMEVWGEYFSDLKCEPNCNKCNPKPKKCSECKVTLDADGWCSNGCVKMPKPIAPKGKGAGSPVASCACKGNDICGKHYVERARLRLETQKRAEAYKKARISKQREYDNSLKVMQTCKICERVRVAGRDTCGLCLKKGVYSPDTLKQAHGREDRRQVTLPSGRRIVRPGNVPSFATATEQYNAQMMRDEVVWDWSYEDTGPFTYNQGLPDIETFDIINGDGIRIASTGITISADLSSAAIETPSDAAQIVPMMVTANTHYKDELAPRRTMRLADSLERRLG